MEVGADGRMQAGARAGKLSPGNVSVSPAQQKQLSRDGFAFMPSLLSPEEVAYFRPHLVNATLDAYEACLKCDSNEDLHDEVCRGCERTRRTPASQRKSFIRVKKLHRRNPVVKELVQSRRLAEVAARYLGVDAVRLYQDTAFFKEPGDVESSWHQVVEYPHSVV